MSMYIEDHLPVVKYQGLNTTKAVDFSGAASMTLPSAATATSMVLTTPSMTTPTVTSGDVTVTTGNLVMSANGAGVSFTGTGTNGGILTNLWNSASSTLGGTQKDIKILIGTVPFYFTTYQTKS